MNGSVRQDFAWKRIYQGVFALSICRFASPKAKDIALIIDALFAAKFMRQAMFRA